MNFYGSNFELPMKKPMVLINKSATSLCARGDFCCVTEAPSQPSSFTAMPGPPRWGFQGAKKCEKKNVVHLGKMGDEIFHKVGKIFLLFGFYDIFAIWGNFWKSTQLSFGISLFWITRTYDLHHLARKILLFRNPAPVNR